MPTPSQCLECNAPLTAADAGGLCPKCLLKLGLASQLASGSLPATANGLRDDGTIEAPFDFGGYRILRLLGKGGMGAVYEAEQLGSGRRVALKVLGQTLDTPEMRARFVREGQLAAAVRHPNVVAVLGAEEIEGTPVIVMELLHDGTLKDRVKQRGPLPVAEAVDAVLQIIDGLEAAHAVGVLHRDVKPANCFRAATGDGESRRLRTLHLDAREGGAFAHAERRSAGHAGLCSAGATSRRRHRRARRHLRGRRDALLPAHRQADARRRNARRADRRRARAKARRRAHAAPRHSRADSRRR